MRPPRPKPASDHGPPSRPPGTFSCVPALFPVNKFDNVSQGLLAGIDLDDRGRAPRRSSHATDRSAHLRHLALPLLAPAAQTLPLSRGLTLETWRPARTTPGCASPPRPTLTGAGTCRRTAAGTRNPSWCCDLPSTEPGCDTAWTTGSTYLADGYVQTSYSPANGSPYLSTGASGTAAQSTDRNRR